MQMHHWIGTDQGLVRETNEDAFLWLGPESCGGRGWLWVVADGMGGAARGDLASATVVQTMAEVWPRAVQQMDPASALEQAILEANARLLRLVEVNPALRGMGSTVAALSVVDGRAWVAHVGDSRVYGYRQGKLFRLTEDHTRTSSQGRLAARDGQDSVLSRVVGRPGLQVDLGTRTPLELHSDACFVLCTDGVWSSIEEKHISAALERLRPRDAVEALAELSRIHWSDDNLTLAVIRMAQPSPVLLTDRAGFLDWVSGVAPSIGGTHTVVFQAPTARPDEGLLPPPSNIALTTAGQPLVAVPSAPDAAATNTGTMTFSPQQIQAMLAGLQTAAPTAVAAAAGAVQGGGMGAPLASQPGAVPWAGAEPAGDGPITQNFSPGELATAREMAGGRTGLVASLDSVETQVMSARALQDAAGVGGPAAGGGTPPMVSAGGSTQVFSPQQIQAAIAAGQGGVAGLASGGAAKASAPVASVSGVPANASGAEMNASSVPMGGSTQAFSPQQVQAMLAGVSPAPPVASTQPNGKQPVTALLTGAAGQARAAFAGSGATIPPAAPSVPLRGGAAGSIVAVSGIGSTLPPPPTAGIAVHAFGVGPGHPAAAAGGGPVVRASVMGAAPVRPGGNASTMGMSGADLSELRRRIGVPTAPPAHLQRQRTMAMTEEEIAALRALQEDPLPPPSNRGRALVLVAVGGALLVAAWLLWTRFVQTPPPALEASGMAPQTEARVYPPAPPIPAAAAPRPPDGVHAGDGMPWYRVSVPGPDGTPIELRVDAHEVTAAQLAQVRAAVPDVELVYRTSSQALFELLPCDGVRSGEATASRRPACAVPETAEVYCNALGRRLPTAADWEAILAAAGPSIAPHRGMVWELAASGPAPETPIEVTALLGVYDGALEVLRGDREGVVRGDLPLLGGSANGPATSVRAGLLTDLRTRSLAAAAVPMLGFRCIEAAASNSAIGAVHEPPLSAPVRSAAAPEPAAAPARSAAAPEPAAAPVRSAAAPERAAAPNRGTASNSGTGGAVHEPPLSAPARSAAAPEPSPEAEPGAEAPAPASRVQLMDPVYLPPTIEEYERLVEERAGEGSAP